VPLVVRQDVKLSYAAASKRSIWEYDPRTRAAEDYSKLVDYLLARLGNEKTNESEETVNTAAEAELHG
jgi:cellulose biosynthesis protein BcsQ